MSDWTPNQGDRDGLYNGTRIVSSVLFCSAGIAIIVMFFLFPTDAARGWLWAFIIFSQIVLGSLALLLIDILTSTSWGRAFGPVLRALLFGIPLVALYWIAVAVNLGRIYPWAGHNPNIPADVKSIYLGITPFILRSLVALAGWTFIAILLLRGTVSRVTAALGLAFFGLTSYVFGFDWILSISAPFISSSFFAEIAIQSILAALAVAAIFAPTVEDARARADLGALILAAALAVFYFSLMTLIVFWYGDLPDQAEWYLDRLGAWVFAAIAAVVLLSAMPILSLLFDSVRKSGIGLRLVAISVLLGIAAHNAWLLAPLMKPLALICGLIAIAAMTGLFVLVRSWRHSPRIQRSRGYA